MDKQAYLAEVSSLMLEGWSMLSRVCPTDGCGHCALLGKKSTNEIQCANCKAYFVSEADAARMSAGASGGGGGGCGLTAAAPSIKECQDRATKRMGELMLQGWGMMAQSCQEPGCPGIPLMRMKGTAVGVCVNCNPNLEDPAAGAANGAAAASPAAKAPLPAPAAPGALPKALPKALPEALPEMALKAPPRPTPRELQAAASARMGELMLEVRACSAERRHGDGRSVDLRRCHGAAGALSHWRFAIAPFLASW